MIMTTDIRNSIIQNVPLTKYVNPHFSSAYSYDDAASFSIKDVLGASYFQVYTTWGLVRSIDGNNYVQINFGLLKPDDSTVLSGLEGVKVNVSYTMSQQYETQELSVHIVSITALDDSYAGNASSREWWRTRRGVGFTPEGGSTQFHYTEDTDTNIQLTPEGHYPSTYSEHTGESDWWDYTRTTWTGNVVSGESPGHRLYDAIEKLEILGYNVVRTWGNCPQSILQTLRYYNATKTHESQKIYMQVGIYISDKGSGNSRNPPSDDNPPEWQVNVDTVMERVQMYKDVVCGVSLGNEYLADWKSNGSTFHPYVTMHAQYVREKYKVPVTYNMWVTNNDEHPYRRLIETLDYVCIHPYNDIHMITDRNYDPDEAYNNSFKHHVQDFAHLVHKSHASHVNGSTADGNDPDGVPYTWQDTFAVGGYDANNRSASDADTYDFAQKYTPIVIGETGWQHSGGASASAGKYRDYFDITHSYVYNDPSDTVEYRKPLDADLQVDSMFYFNFVDEAWKGGDANWGIFDEGDERAIGSININLGHVTKTISGDGEVHVDYTVEVTTKDTMNQSTIANQVPT